MLRFFRNIRRRLLESGSLQKYLVYAIGEILLVVIGILIALQVNNWNGNRKINTERKQLYENLEEEFSIAKKMYSIKKQEYAVVMEAAQKILVNTGSDYSVLEVQEFDSLLQLAIAPVVYNPSFVAFQEIMDNNIELIKHPTIKQLLYQYKAINEDYRAFDRVVLRDMSEEVIPYLNKRIAFKNLPHPYQVNPSVILKDNRQILKELEFENLLDNYIFIQFILISNFEQLGEVTDRLLTELELINS